MQWFGRPHSLNDLAEYANKLATNKLACVFGHAGDLINLGAPISGNRDKSIKSLIQEINLATDLGMPFLVLHPGAHLGAGEESGMKQIVAGLNEVFGPRKIRQCGLRWRTLRGRGLAWGTESNTSQPYSIASNNRSAWVSVSTPRIYLRQVMIYGNPKLGMPPLARLIHSSASRRSWPFILTIPKLTLARTWIAMPGSGRKKLIKMPSAIS